MKSRSSWKPATCRLCAAVTLLGSQAAAINPRLAGAVPDDAVAAAFVQPSPTREDTVSALDMARLASDGAQRLGLLAPVDDTVRRWIDALAAVSVAAHDPFALTLLDVDARPRRDGGHELARLSAAFVTLTDGENQPIEERIRHFLRAYTNSEQSAVSTHQSVDQSWYVLRDERLPDWAEITWGATGPAYLVTVGAGSRDRVAPILAADTGRLLDDEWFREAFRRTDAARAVFALYTNLGAVQRGADPALRHKVHDTKQGLGLGGASRTLFTCSQIDRALEIKAYARIGGNNQLLPLAGKEFLDDAGLSIPEAATGYTAIAWQPVPALRGIARAYLSTRSPDSCEDSRVFWRDLQTQSGVSIEQQIFAHLGPVVVVHNYPKHALRLPMAWTVIVPIEGHAETVRTSVDKLLGYVSRELVPHDATIQLRRDEDGIWYLHFGLLGPAVTVTDRFLILSFSPTALRQNLELLNDK